MSKRVCALLCPFVISESITKIEILISCLVLISKILILCAYAYPSAWLYTRVKGLWGESCGTPRVGDQAVVNRQGGHWDVTRVLCKSSTRS